MSEKSELIPDPESKTASDSVSNSAHETESDACSSKPAAAEKGSKGRFCKAAGQVRWSYLYPRFALVGLFCAGCVFGLEPLGHLLFTRGATALLQTPVGVDQLALQVYHPVIDMNRVQIADRDAPGRNAVEMNRVQVSFDRTALLKKKFIVNQATVSGIRWDTASTLSPLPEEEAAEGWGNPFSEQAKRLAGMAAQGGGRLLQTLLEGALDELDPEILETVRLANAKESQWKARYEGYRMRAEKFHADVERLESQIEQIKRGNPLDHLERYVDIGREVDRLLAEGEQLKRELTGLTSVARVDIAELDEARKRDIARIEQGIDSIPLNSDELMVTLVGPETARQLEELAAWIGFFRKCSSIATDDYEPERGTGVFVDFDRSTNLPTYLLRQFDVDGIALVDGQDCPFQGTICDLTPSVKSYDRPARFELQVGYHGDCRMTGVCDFRGEEPQIAVTGLWNSAEAGEQTLANLQGRQLELRSGTLAGKFNLTLTGEQLDGKIWLQQSDVDIHLANKAEPAAENTSSLKSSLAAAWSPDDILNEGFAGIESLQTQIDLSGSVRQPRIAIQSDVGDTLRNGLQQALATRMQASREQLAGLANQQIDQRMQEFTLQIDKEYRGLLADLKVDQDLAQRLLDQTAVRPTSGVLNRIFR